LRIPPDSKPVLDKCACELEAAFDCDAVVPFIIGARNHRYPNRQVRRAAGKSNELLAGILLFKRYDITYHVKNLFNVLVSDRADGDKKLQWLGCHGHSVHSRAHGKPLGHAGSDGLTMPRNISTKAE
jgi:hypothetical protein